MFFWNSSARIWSVFKSDTHMDGSVLAELAAYQNNLLSSENDDVTSGSMSRPQKSGKVNLCSERVKTGYGQAQREINGKSVWTTLFFSFREKQHRLADKVYQEILSSSSSSSSSFLSMILL